MQEKRYKKGDVREDGYVFWAYGKSYPCGEYWVTKEKYNSMKEKREKNRIRYYQENKKEIARKYREHREQNREKLNKRYRDYYKNHKDRVALANKKWREKNWGRMSGLLARYRARKRGQTPDLTLDQKKIIGVLFEQAVRLKKTLGIPFEVDHIVPISLGGSHHPCNLQVMPRRLNRIKHNRGIYRWAEKSEKII